MKSIDGSCGEISRSPSRAASSSTANQVLTFCALITQRQSWKAHLVCSQEIFFIHFRFRTNTCIGCKLRPSNFGGFTHLTYLDDCESRQRGRKQKESEANRLIPGNDQSLSWNSCNFWNRRATFLLVHSQLSSHWTFFNESTTFAQFDK